MLRVPSKTSQTISHRATWIKIGFDTNKARPFRQAARKAKEFIDTVMAGQSSDSEQ